MLVGHLKVGPRDGGDYVPGEVVSWHLLSFPINHFEVILVHGFGQTLVCPLVHLAEASERQVISKQQEMSASKVMLEVFDTPKHTLHLEQERRVVLYVGGELYAGIPDGMMITVGVNLR